MKKPTNEQLDKLYRDLQLMCTKTMEKRREYNDYKSIMEALFPGSAMTNHIKRLKGEV